MALQPCTFRVEYTLDNIPGREFGSIFIGAQNENVAASVVAAGWAKVRALLLTMHICTALVISYAWGTDVMQDQPYVLQSEEGSCLQASQTSAAFLSACMRFAP